MDSLPSINSERVVRKATEKSINPDYVMDEEDLRFATDNIVAKYRADRLKCKKIVDLCCGIGIQAIAFAKQCDKVLAIDLDEKRAIYAKKNTELENLKNIEIIHGDALSSDIIKKIEEFKPDIIFCDPERLVSEEERSILTIKPDMRKLLEIYSKITNKIAIEFPPQIKKIELTEEYEKEYLSLGGKLNRLTLYFGALKTCNVSCVSLPSKSRIESSDKKRSDKSEILSYIYEIDTAIVKADLVTELCNSIEDMSIVKQSEKPYLTSKKLISNPFLQAYKFITYCKSTEETIDVLKKISAGKVVLKKSIDPKDYWYERKRYEKDLKGEKQVSLFFISDCDVLAEKIVKD